MDDNISGVKIYYCDLDSCKYDKSLHFDFKCINYDVKYSWSAFENYKSITLNREYMSNNNLDRILIVIDNQNGEWSKQYWRNEIVYHWTHMNKLISFQNNTVQNTPPEVLSFPNHNIKCNCESRFRPTIISKDNDIIKCRKSMWRLYNGINECGSCSNQYDLNADTCTLTFPASLRNSPVVEIQIEIISRPRTNRKSALSRPKNCPNEI